MTNNNTVDADEINNTWQNTVIYTQKLQYIMNDKWTDKNKIKYNKDDQINQNTIQGEYNTRRTQNKEGNQAKMQFNKILCVKLFFTIESIS